MTQILNRTGKQWLLLAVLVVIEVVVIFGITFAVPEVGRGVRGWLFWIVVIGVNVLFMRYYFAPQEQQLQ